MPYVPGFGIPPAGTPPGPPVTETQTTPGTGDAGSVPGGTPPPSPRVHGYTELDYAAEVLGDGLKFPGASGADPTPGPGFNPTPPPAPGEPGAADEGDSEPRKEIG
jgi:hypothetical protein